MKLNQHRLISLALAALVCCAGGASPAVADDSEVFTSAAFTSGAGARPNILFVIDTSGSMDAEVTSYDPDVTYTGPCDNGRVYWRTTNTDEPPNCATTTSVINEAANTCRASFARLKTEGFWRGRTQQFNPAANQWQNARAGATNDPFECEADSGVHGETDASAARFARNNATRWTTNAGLRINWNGRQSLTLYTGNYANWYYGAGDGYRATRWEIVRDVAKELIDDLEGVNLGLMRYSNNGDAGDAVAEGGMVMHPVAELTTASRTSMKNLLDAWGPNGWTPLSETLYEATQYFRGGTVEYGNSSRLNGATPALSVKESRVGGVITGTNYNSPIDFNCQNNYVVYLTDGLPTQDAGGESKIQALPDFAELGGECDAVNPDTGWADSGRCMVSLARYLATADHNTSVIGKQSVKTYMIGFGSDIAAAKPYLDDVARAGGTGESYAANSVAGLANTLQEIFTNIVEGKDVTFVSPTLSVNAFNRTRNLNDLYVSVFSPARGLHWPGNLKKYQIKNGKIVDKNEKDAVDPATGFFKDTAQSIWSKNISGTDIVDGPEVTLGGASSLLPEYVESSSGRKLYTYLGSEAKIYETANEIVSTNTALEAAMDLGGPSDPAVTDVIAWARGKDVLDANRKDGTDERRMRMGDPMHAKPALVIYGGDADEPEGVVYVPTNDGYLHAFDSQTGEELWAFIPPEHLPRIPRLYEDAVTPVREYALDGDVTVFKYDVNGDGAVTGDDRVYLFFGFGRGGSVYYALDVTEKTKPVFLWKATASELPGLGKAWSPPTVARVNVAGSTQGDQKFVLIFGGGYDEAQENYSYTVDTVGNRIFMLDLEDGELLWYAGNDSGADLQLSDMNNSIPSRVTVLDTNADKFADRMYVGDMGGRLWRFDIWNGQTASDVVTGGVIAELGAGGVASPSLSITRRFYNAPDVAIIQRRGSQPFFNIAIGSGYRGHPLSSDTQDRFYSIRDYLPFTKLTTAQYAALTPITDADLVDITTDLTAVVGPGAKGWKLLLNDGGSWNGEKVLAESITVAGVILFPTFIPLGEDTTTPCTARMVNRAYAVRVENGRPAFDSDDDESWERSDRYTELKQSGIAAEIAVLFNDKMDDGPDSSPPGDPTDPPDDDDPPSTTCTTGVEVLARCVDVSSSFRTYWQRR